MYVDDGLYFVHVHHRKIDDAKTADKGADAVVIILVSIGVFCGLLCLAHIIHFCVYRCRSDSKSEHGNGDWSGSDEESDGMDEEDQETKGIKPKVFKMPQYSDDVRHSNHKFMITQDDHTEMIRLAKKGSLSIGLNE